MLNRNVSFYATWNHVLLFFPLAIAVLLLVEFVRFESLAELLEPIRIPSSVVTFSVNRGLVLMRLQLIVHKLGEDCSPDHGSFPVAKYECLWTRVSW